MTGRLARHAFRSGATWMLRVCLLAALGVPGFAEKPAGRVVAIRFWSLGDVTRIAIETDSEIRYRSDRVPNPDRIFFDLQGIKPKTPRRGIQSIAVGDKLLKQIRVAETQPGVTRIVLDVQGGVEYSASQLTVPDRLVVELRVAGKEPVVPPVRSVTGHQSIQREPSVAEGANPEPALPAPGRPDESPKPVPGSGKAERAANKPLPGSAAGSQAAGSSKAEGPAGATPVETKPERAATTPGETKRIAAAGTKPATVKPGERTVVPTPKPEHGAVAPDAKAPRPVPVETGERTAAPSIATRSESAKPAPGAKPERGAVAQGKPVESGKTGADAGARPGEPEPPVMNVSETGKPGGVVDHPVASKLPPSAVPVRTGRSETEKPNGETTPARPGTRPGDIAITPESKPARSAEDPGAAAVAQRDSHGNRSLIRALGLKLGRVVLDPGHGGHDTGTVGPGGLAEKDLVLDIAKRLGGLIAERMGSEVVYTRSDDTFVPLETRTEFANDKKADLFLSIHANSSRVKNISGPETFYLSLSGSAAEFEVAALENATSQRSIYELQELIQKIARKQKVQESREFASIVQTALHTGLRGKAEKNRGVKKAPFVVLIGAQMPSVLAEVAFLSNPRDERMLKRPDYRQRIAEALFKGVTQYANTLSHFQVARRGGVM